MNHRAKALFVQVIVQALILATCVVLIATHVSAQVVVTDQQSTTKISIVFYVKDGTNSPYQGLLQFTPEEYAALRPGDLEAKQIEQFNAWKANTAALQAYQAAHENDVPAQVTAAQARKAVLAAGLKDAVEAAVAGADKATQDLWYTAENIERSNPVLLALARAIGLTDEQLDDLFRSAARL